MRVDVVIPVHGNWELTEQCLETLPREAPLDQVIVVDDASPDDTAGRLASRGDVVPVVLERNRGFAGACNAGADRARADAILFLNNDTIVPRGAIARLAEKLEADPTLGAIGPKLLYADGTIQTAGSMLTSKSSMIHLYVHLDATTPQANHPRDDLLLTGAALLVRRRLFTSLGGFHEAFRNGIEDCDLCMRIWAEGYRCRYEPTVTIFHLEGASRGKQNQPDDEANRALFAARGGGVLSDFPQLAWNDPPAVALRWHARDGLDRLVRNRILTLLKRYGGARHGVVRNAAEDVMLRILARFDHRALLEVAYGEQRGDVRILAPRAPGELDGMEADDGARYWVPSEATRAMLIERGISAERISTLRIGASAEPRKALERLARAVILVDSQTRAEREPLSRIRRALDGVLTTIVSYSDAGDEALAAVRAASLLIVLDEDPWGLLLTEALATGALVVAPRATGSLEIFPPAAFVGYDANTLPDVVADVRARFDDYAPRGARGAREVARRLPEMYVGERLRRLATVAAHGVPDAGAIAVSPQLAASLRRSNPARPRLLHHGGTGTPNGIGQSVDEPEQR
ncbi:MAG TPA: glycosyltransferase family 2 protein, partial [Candidatus Acidoferrum sp.]|nr:glycosyltransferase family 2 protein [Candidatus Acidoferrum sp.]